MEELNFPDVSASQPYTPNKVDKTEETSPVCGQTVIRFLFKHYWCVVVWLFVNLYGEESYEL